MDVDATISNTPTAHNAVQGAGGVSVLAEDTSQIDSGAGTLVATGKGAAINASVGINDIQNSVTASITAADVSSSAGPVTVEADETAQDINVVVGGAGSGSGGIAAGRIARVQLHPEHDRRRDPEQCGGHFVGGVRIRDGLGPGRGHGVDRYLGR